MILTQVQEYKSIKGLPDIDLPPFTVITGINGSGKSHLLEAIEKSALKVGEITKEKGIKYFDTRGLLSQFDSPANTEIQKKRRKEALDAAKRSISQNLHSLFSYFRSQKITGPSQLLDTDWLCDVEEEALEAVLSTATRTRLSSSFDAKGAAKSFLSHRRMLEQNVFSHIGQYGELANILSEYSKQNRKSILRLTSNEIDLALPLLWTPSNGIALRFAEWFRLYYVAWEKNRMRRYFSESLGENIDWLSEEEFARRFGPKPWEMANTVLEQCGASYRFDPPKFASITEDLSDEIAITDIFNSGAKILISDLSTGEKTLLGIISLLYRATASQTLSRLPEIILLDEIDGPLHPAYTRPLIAVIQETLVNRCGISVILVTHSPSTVALAPEEAIFELSKTPRLLIKSTRAHAISTLTSGFISVLPSSRVIITESAVDATIYSNYYNILVSNHIVNSEPSLSFLPASGRKNANGGKQEVKKWAGKLSNLFSELGFFGLVDGEAKDIESATIKSINRHSIENYVLDPLTIIALLVKEGITSIFSNANLQDMNFHRIPDLTELETQTLVDEFINIIPTEEITDLAASQVLTHYIGCKSVLLPKWFIDSQGHNVEKTLKSTINNLCQKQGRNPILPTSDPLARAIEMQTICLPALISRDFGELFQAFQKSGYQKIT